MREHLKNSVEKITSVQLKTRFNNNIKLPEL